MAKRQFCFTIEEELMKKYEKISRETGMPVSKVIELELKGYEISKKRK